MLMQDSKANGAPLCASLRSQTLPSTQVFTTRLSRQVAYGSHKVIDYFLKDKSRLALRLLMSGALCMKCLRLSMANTAAEALKLADYVPEISTISPYESRMPFLLMAEIAFRSL